MVDYVMIIFAMVRYNKYEYLKQDVFPLEQQEDLKKKKKIYQLFKNIVLF